MSKRQKLSGVAYRKLKATKEHEERKCAASLQVFLQKKYVAKAKHKDKDAERTTELGGEEPEENVNMVDTNIKIKVEEEFLAGINVVKRIEGDNDDVLKEESSRACDKDRYEYEEGTDEVTGNKEIEQANTEIAVYKDIAFWLQTYSEQL